MNYNKFFLAILFFALSAHYNLALNSNFSYNPEENENYTDYLRSAAMDSNLRQAPFLLQFLYTNFFGSFIRASLTHKWFSVFAGWYCNRSISKFHIQSFVKNHAIDLCQAEQSLNQFKTFNEFFIRKLKPEARPFDVNPHTIISPADGKVIIFNNCSQSMNFPIKQAQFNLEQFLGCPQLSNTFEGGTIMIFRLAPHDYHRFHFPLDCIPLTTIMINGRYESVNPLVYYTGVQPLTHNERQLTLLASRQCGTVALVSIGALCVGKISQTHTPHRWHKKGDEAGYFSFGGSTIVLVFKKGTLEVNPEIISNSIEGRETAIKMGQKVASIRSS